MGRLRARMGRLATAAAGYRAAAVGSPGTTGTGASGPALPARRRGSRLRAVARGICASLFVACRRPVRHRAGGPADSAALGGSRWRLGRLFVLDATRRFGLIDAEDGRIVYFHLDAVVDVPLEAFVEGAAVLFDEKLDRLGRQARTVCLISASGTAGAIPESLPTPPNGETGEADRDRSRSVA